MVGDKAQAILILLQEKNKTKISKIYKTKRIERSNNLVTKVIN
jgi:IS1 family transposase